MLFWAGLRGAVGVALAARLGGPNSNALRTTVLVVVVLTVIIFGGTTARMLEILGIQTGVVEEIDSDDEFDIETVAGGTYYKRSGNAVGHNPRRSSYGVPLSPVDIRREGQNGVNGGTYTSGNASPPIRPEAGMAARKGSHVNPAQQSLLGNTNGSNSEDEDHESDEDDLPPAARRPARRHTTAATSSSATAGTYPTSGTANHSEHPENHMSARTAITQLFSGTADDQAAWFRQIDEGFIKPTLLLDQNQGAGRGGGGGSGAV
jgi:sodium/hydrogen exchanger-like protein 6/7